MLNPDGLEPDLLRFPCLVSPGGFYRELIRLCDKSNNDQALMVGVIEVLPAVPTMMDQFLKYESEVFTLAKQMLAMTFNSDELLSYTDNKQFLIALHSNKINIEDILKMQLAMVANCVNEHFTMSFKVIISFSYTTKMKDLPNFPDQLIERAQKSVKWFINGSGYETLSLES